MSLIDRQMAEEIAKKWRKEHPEEAKELDEIFKDEAKLKAWLEAKGFHFSEKRWRIVGFNHPEQEKSLIYLQNLTDRGLLKAIEKGMERGCNLFSIRGFKVEA